MIIILYNVISLDSFSSPFKTQPSVSLWYFIFYISFTVFSFMQSSSDHGLRSILEENSVDYINKFKELASAMNHTS